FTVTGVAVAISARLDPVWLWAPLLAMLTAAGRGMLRDLVQQAGQLASLHRDFYAEGRGRRLPRARRHRRRRAAQLLRARVAPGADPRLPRRPRGVGEFLVTTGAPTCLDFSSPLTLAPDRFPVPASWMA